MKSIFKKIAFVLALAMVVTAFPAKTAAAASVPSVKKTKTLYIGGDVNEQYNDGAWVPVYNKKGYTMTFESSDPEIVTVKKGWMTAVSTGEADVTVTFSKEGEKDITGKCTVIVKKNATAATLDEESVKAISEMKVGDKVTVKAVLTDADGATDTTDYARFASSDTAVVTVDKKTGEVTAVAEGTAKILVHASQWDYNKETKKWKLTTTTKDTEYEVVVKKADIASAKQISSTTVAVTCDTEELAAAIAADASKLNVTYTLGENEIKAFVNTVKVDDKDKKVINVALYSALTKDIVYNYQYDGGAVVSVKGADLTAVAGIAITTTSAVQETATQIKVAFYDVNGIEINTGSNLLTFTAPDSIDYFISGNEIYFYEAGKSAVVTATYDMGYDKDGNKNQPLTSTATIVSTSNASTYGNVIGWKMNSTAAAAADNGDYKTEPVKLAATDVSGNLYLSLKFVETAYYGATSNKYIANGTDNVASPFLYEYQSTNDAVVLVGSDGKLSPASAGTAQIVVRRYTASNPNNKIVVGIVPVEVAAGRTLSSLTVTANKTKLAKANIGTTDKVILDIVAKDQLGASYNGNTTFTAEVLDCPADVSLVVSQGSITLDSTKQTFTPNYSHNNNPAIEITAATANASQAKNVMVRINATDNNNGAVVLSKVVTISTKMTSGAAIANYALNLSKTNIDLNFATLAGYQNDGEYKSNISVDAYDAAGFLVQNMAIATTGVTNGVTLVAPASNGMYYTVTKGNDDMKALVTGNVFSPVTNAAMDLARDTAKNAYNGTYVIRVYDITLSGSAILTQRMVASKSITLTDSSATTTAKVSVNTLNDKTTKSNIIASLQALVTNDKLTFTRSGAPINKGKIVITDIEYREANGKVVVTSITIKETIPNNGNYTFTHKVNVGAMVFE